MGEIFDKTEDLENVDMLTMLYYIYKGLVLLSHSRLIEIMFGDEYYLQTFGALECNLPYDLLMSHRLSFRRS